MFVLQDGRFTTLCCPWCLGKRTFAYFSERPEADARAAFSSR